jgi:glycosyltransferase involved in cell wall biosynthesis
MNVGILMPTMGITGGVRRVVEIANRLTQSGNKVTIYNAKTNSAKWMRPIPNLYTQKHISSIYEEFEKDVWLCGWPNFPPQYYSILKGKKFFMIQHIEGTWPNLIRLDGWETISFSTYAFNYAYGVKPEGCFKVIGGINMDLFKNIDLNKVITHKHKDRIVFLAYPRKGAKHLVKALNLLNWNTDEFEVQYIGDPYTDDCNLSKYYRGVYYKGNTQDKMKEIYGNAHFYVSTQTPRACWENLVAESIASGCLVIAYRIGAMQDMEPACFRVWGPSSEESYVENLAEAINESMLDIVKDEFYFKAKEYIEQFSWNNIFPKFLEILKHE